MELDPSWRSVLGTIIRDTQERAQLANALDMNPHTLIRWANNISDPRPQNLRGLLQALPQYHHILLPLIQEEFPTFQQTSGQAEPGMSHEHISSTFYSHVLDTYTTTPKMQRAWSVTAIILQQILRQFAMDHNGMAVTLVQCLPPASSPYVRSLRERTGYGTHPWQLNLVPYSILLGTESLAGAAVSTAQPQFIHSLDDQPEHLDTHWSHWEKSVAAFPILRSGYIAGCLLVSSTQPNFFIAERKKLLRDHAELLALAFEPNEFYAPEHIHLHRMPPYQYQEHCLATFRQRVTALTTQRHIAKHPIQLVDAELHIWQQMEDEFIHLPPEIYTTTTATTSP